MLFENSHEIMVLLEVLDMASLEILVEIKWRKQGDHFSKTIYLGFSEN